MLIKNMTNRTYKKLIEYAVGRFDTFSLNKCNNQFAFVRDKCTDICRIILSDPNFSDDIIFNNYSEDLINKICKKYKDHKGIKKAERNYLENTYPNKIENIDEYMEVSIPFTIKYSLEMFMYDKNCEVFNKKYSKYRIDNYSANTKFPDYISTYYFKLNNESKNILLSKKSIYEWINPLSLEDLCLYKHGDMWLWSVAHEEICDIACVNEEEYEYLKSMGVEFYEDEFVCEK